MSSPSFIYSNLVKNESIEENNVIGIPLLRKKSSAFRSVYSVSSYIEVYVFDGVTALPLKDALIEVTDQITGALNKSGITDEIGFINITDLYVGTFKVDISKDIDPSYQMDTHLLVIDILGEFKGIKSFLIPDLLIKGSIETTVVDITGKPIVNADIEITDIDGNIVSIKTTNESGLAITEVPINLGKYKVKASAVGYYENTKTTKINWYGDYNKVTITLLPKGTSVATVEVTSIDASTKRNLSYVHLEIFNDSETSIWTGMTDVNGHAIFSKLDVGKYRITAHYDTYNEAEKEFIIYYPNDYSKITFHMFPTSLNRGFIEVSVLSDLLIPISSAGLTLYNIKDEVVFTGSTNDFGFYNITNLAQGTYQLIVAADTYFSYQKEIHIRWNSDHKLVEVFLGSHSERGSIKVEFVDINNIPISSVLVKLYDHDKELISSTWTDESVLSISDLNLGKYTIEASKKGFQTGIYTVDLFENKYPENRETLIPSTGTGTLNVCCSMNSFISVTSTSGSIVFSGMSESGEVAIGNLPIGEYDISVFTNEGEQSMLGSINWIGEEVGLLFQDMIDITDNSSCMEFTIYDIEIGLVEDCRVDVITQNGYSFFGYTDINGFVNITGLFLGQYEVVCHKFGYRDTVVPKSIDYKGQKRICVLYIYQAKCDVHIHVSEVFSGLPQPAYVRYKRLGSDWTFLVPTDWNGYKAYYDLPLGFYNFSVMVGGFETQYADVYLNHDGQFENLHFMLTVPGGDGQVDYYALIVAGAGEQRFTHDAHQMYNTLAIYYGFNPSNIYLLTPYDVDPVSGQTVYRDNITSVLAVEWALNEIAMKADGDDQVVIWWTGHGGFYVDASNNIVDGMFETYTDAMGSDHLDILLDNIFCDHMYIFLGPCHSGYWIDDLNDEPNRAIYTSCDWDETGEAYSSHSYWPWATRRAIDPNANAVNADDDNNGKVSLWELFEWADHWVRVTQDCNQHPQRFVGLGVAYGSDFYKYLGDGTYGSPIGGTGSRSQVMDSNIDAKPIYKRTSLDIDSFTGIAVLNTIGLLDVTDDNPSVVFEFYDATGFPNLISVPNVNVSIRNLFGVEIFSGISNTNGRITFTGIDYGLYAWEAFYYSYPIGSGQMAVPKTQIISYAYSNNYDYQGDAADLKIQVEELKKGINVQNALVRLFHVSGEYIGSQSTDINGEVIFNDIKDGLYGYRISIEDESVYERTVMVCSDDFTVKTDNIPPVVTILSPLEDVVYDLAEGFPKISFSVIEKYNYTVNVILDNSMLISKKNNSFLSEITTAGSYSLKVEVVDIAKNIGMDSISFTVIDSPITTSPTTSNPSQVSSNGFITIITIFSLVLSVYLTNRKKKG